MEEEANGGCIFRVFRPDPALNSTCWFEVFGFPFGNNYTSMHFQYASKKCINIITNSLSCKNNVLAVTVTHTRALRKTVPVSSLSLQGHY